MGKRSPYIGSHCIKKLINNGRIPMLFIGSGISKRYLKDYPSWDDLISYIANIIGVTTGQLMAMKQEITDINPSVSKGKINAEIGNKLTKIFREKVESGEIRLEDIFSKDEINIIETKNITFVKMLISKKLSEYKITTNPKYISELNEFKKLQSNIGAVITTNYDKFLENEAFNNFDVFIEQSQYYMTNCMGIGEIYKIHGSIESPNSIIFNKDDYDKFNSDLKVIAAKILNLALDYPIVFLGYSLEDENVLSVLETLVNSLTKEQLETLSNNLIYVDWKKHENELKESQKVIDRDGKTLKMTCITTDNYFVLYKHLLKFVPAEKPERVRKYKKMIQNLIIDNNNGKATIIATENLDKLNSENKLVVAFGEMEQFASKGIVGIKTADIIKWVLEQKKDITEEYANAIFNDFYLSSKVSSNQYIPMFYIKKFTSKYASDEKLTILKNNLLKWVNEINSNKNVRLYRNFNELDKASNELATYKYISCIIKAYHNDKIDYNNCLELLKKLNSKETQIQNTLFKKAVSYIDLKE